MSKEKNFVSAVVYVHNAANTITEYLTEVIACLEENFEHSEIICVNDYSGDDSVQCIKDLATKAHSTSVSVVNMSYFHGLELSMNAGVELAIGDFVFEFDNTILDFTKEDIMRIYNRCLEGYDIVSAAPNRTEKTLSKLFYKLFDQMTDISYQMHTESFRVMSRRVINRIASMNKTVPYRKAVYANAGMKSALVVYDAKKVKPNKKDKQEKKYRVGLAIDSLILFTNAGYRFAMAMTFCMMFISIMMIAYSVVVYLMSHPVAGWTTTILFLSIAFFGLFGILTVIIKYLQLLVGLVFKRKQYSYESIEKLTK